ncbi:DUF305 domain-containing protein [Mycobacterium sp. 21AC1]|uniref:DUF305 domain-containing protein n=1 Tax=[Mycobacterium] appelbergii TaxID=2939269 RepID=UPI0029390E95|nr:DUF305 domain-containing protein [Mycobacterium sp. 21AC1]MDV3124460.1 DUF305 domain-containing protein [Mycobacterium sp. 21AC1]
MRSAALRLLAVVSVLTAMVLLMSCSGAKPDAQPSASASETPAITGEPPGSNGSDVSFATNMLQHHQQSIDLSALVPDRSANADVVALAQSITAARRPEIETMKVLLVQWKESPDTGNGESNDPAQGMIDAATVAQLKTMSGQDFDVLWLQSMIAHAQGAVATAKVEGTNGDNVDAIALANRTVKEQQAEIAQLQQILAAGG